MENQKILYSLGSKCIPHCVLQKKLPRFTSPSLFAGCAANQNESDVFIPQLLFDGSDDILDKRWIAYSEGIITDYAKNLLHQRGLF